MVHLKSKCTTEALPKSTASAAVQKVAFTPSFVRHRRSLPTLIQNMDFFYNIEFIFRF